MFLRIFRAAILLPFFGNLLACDSGPGFSMPESNTVNERSDAEEQDAGAETGNPVVANAQGLVWDEHDWDKKKWQ